MRKKYVNIELSKTDAAKFRTFLKENVISYEPSAAGDNIYFSVYATDSEIAACNAFLDSISEPKFRYMESDPSEMVGREFTRSQLQEVYRNLADKAEYPDFAGWFWDMKRTGILKEI